MVVVGPFVVDLEEVKGDEVDVIEDVGIRWISLDEKLGDDVAGDLQATE